MRQTGRRSPTSPGTNRFDEGLVQLRNVIELSRREPTLAETLRLGPRARIVRCRADGAVVEIAAPEQYLHPVLQVLKEAPQAR